LSEFLIHLFLGSFSRRPASCSSVGDFFCFPFMKVTFITSVVHTPSVKDADDPEAEPRTLAAAKARLRELKEQVLNSKTGKARLGAEEPPPARAPVIILSNSQPAQSEAVSPGLPPMRLKAALANSSNEYLKALLAVETSKNRKAYDSRFISELYAELRSRGVK
jgi:hypothetical protein